MVLLGAVSYLELEVWLKSQSSFSLLQRHEKAFKGGSYHQTEGASKQYY
jgi:hypothetical protein